MKRLPNKPSKLLMLAMTDLEKVEADPRYKVNMSKWHEPNGKCSVCLAGSVIAKTLKVNPGNYITPYGQTLKDTEVVFSYETDKALLALNSLRRGDILLALSRLGHWRPDTHTLPPRLDEPWVGERLDELSDSDREQWKLHMYDLIGILQAEGL